MLVSNFKVCIDKDGNRVINFVDNDVLKRVIISRDNLILRGIFDLYYNQLNSFKNRHYALAKWIVEDIRRMGYIFKEKAIDSNVYVPVKREVNIVNGFEKGVSKEEKLRLLWLELDLISKKFELIY